MQEPRFTVIFEKLSAMERVEINNADGSIITEQLRDEMNEINELRRIVTETMDPEIKSYTTT